MNRVYLKKQAGLLFYFPHESHITMWMKNTAIPLDIIWMDKKKRVVDLYHHAKPYSKKKLRSQKKAKYVLEINAGLAKLYNFKEGDQANFD